MGASRDHLVPAKMPGIPPLTSLPKVAFQQDESGDEMSCIPCSIANGLHHNGFPEQGRQVFLELQSWIKEHQGLYVQGDLGPACDRTLQLANIARSWILEKIPGHTDIFSLDSSNGFLVVVPQDD